MVIQKNERFFKFWKLGAWKKRIELENNNCNFSKTISQMGFLDFFFFMYIINRKSHFFSYN